MAEVLTDPVRCFVGIAISDTGLDDVFAQAMAHWREQPRFAAVRWTPPAFLHLTLAFLGQQPLSRVDALSQRLNCVAEFSSITLEMRRFAAFPDASSPILAALPVLTPALDQLHECVTACVRAEGIEPDVRPFRPHVTVGRLGKGQAVPVVDEAFPGLGRARAVSFYRSEPVKAGSHYSVLQCWPLVGAG